MFPKLAQTTPAALAVARGHRLAQNLKAFYRLDPKYVQGLVVRDLLGNVDAILEDSSGISSCRRMPLPYPASGIMVQSSANSLRVPGTIWNFLGVGPFTFCFWQYALTFPNLGSVFDTATTHVNFALGDGSTNCTNCKLWYNGNSTANLTLPLTVRRESITRFTASWDGLGNVSVWVNGQSKVTGTHSLGIVGSFTDPISFGTGVGGAAGNRHDGGVGDLCLHAEYFDDRLAALDYQEASRGFPGLLPRYSIVGKAFSGINASATPGSPGTITLSAPSASATADATATAASPGTITLTAPTFLAYANADATATAGSPGTITLTAPTVTAFESQDGTATLSSPGTITLTTPTISATSDGTATVASPGTVRLTAATARARPDYIYAPKLSYRGRFLRGGVLPITVCFTEMPDAAPQARLFRGTSLVQSLRIPVVDAARRVFGLDLRLGTEYLDGNYLIAYVWTVDSNAQYSLESFDVLGGTGRPAITAVVEQKRPLGRSIEYVDDDGVARLGYAARIAQ